MQNKCNEAIGCTVDSCQYHHGAKNYCSLDSILVGAHEPDPKTSKSVDCESFRSRS